MVGFNVGTEVGTNVGWWTGIQINGSVGWLYKLFICSDDNINTINAGSDIDINGNPEMPGTGRKAAIARNEAKYGSQEGPGGYGPDKPYYPGYIMSEE